MEQHGLTNSTPLPLTSPTMDTADELLVADVDEPPEHPSHWTPSQLSTTFAKTNTAIANRRESLLTLQLHSEAEPSTDDDAEASRAPARALSTQSTWSNPSVASTAELTSDDGHSVASPAISPPLPPTAVRTIIPITDKPLSREPQILGLEERSGENNPEQTVEAGLGRKRCISFACGGKDKKPPTSQPVAPVPAEEAQPISTSPPKRKCAIKFVCPTKNGVDSKPTERITYGRRVSPPPPERKPSRAEAMKTHRGSDSTVTHVSPTNVKKTPAIHPIVATPTTPIADPFSTRRMSNNSNSSTEATRFHEFASSEDEPEEWVQESGCHRSRLTVNDTLQKENILRKACQEVEEEVVEEDEDEDEDVEDDNGEDDDDNDEDGAEEDEEEESDDGFRTDDEEGFAESDSEGEESDEDWWRPGGRSTAATSIDHIDRLAIVQKDDDPASSVGSASSTQISPRGLRIKSHRKRNSHAVTIDKRPEQVDLPDSTDFVCGTLDEDRPMEQAYLNQLKQKEASKHKARPQDIDPTFPTSDPEMDEEDDEDLEDPEESEKEDLMHGELDELDEAHQTLRPSTRPRARSNAKRSPPPPTRRGSPAPALLKRQPTARSPAPAMLKRQPTARSPPPPTRRSTARSPPPRKLFGQSPKRSRSPPPKRVMPSPPNTRRVSPWASAALDIESGVLASRPQLTHTASLPRSGFTLGKVSSLRFDDATGSDTVDNNANGDIPKRGAIDIYKGLEKKRQRRKEKLYQKLCAKAAAKGEKAYKVKPGRGAERMREVGLELQRYHGKGEHILSM